MNRALAPALALLLAACAGLSGCGLNQAGVTPPADTIAFPASAVLDREGDWLFVTNSNADLRYNDGSLVAFSLDRLTKDREPYDPKAPKPYAGPAAAPSPTAPPETVAQSFQQSLVNKLSPNAAPGARQAVVKSLLR